YEKARQLNPDRPEAYFNLGVLYQDYRDGSEASLNQATQYFRDFLQKAGNRPEYGAAVDAVSRRCATEQRGQQKRRRWQRGTCQMGRLQQIETSIQLMREAAQMQAEMNRLQGASSSSSSSNPQ
ncbi:MAG: tetratricopeptide repeat protein, partial [Deltaproteobacteria bacterium]|nr:tetratricopeptide repeat protein [Deltaproteobacteria bacterium]